jgi:DNA-binding protein HU-beta
MSRRSGKDVQGPSKIWQETDVSFSVILEEGAREMAKACKAMTKAQIMAQLAAETCLSKKDVVAVLDNLVQLAYKEAKKCSFTIPGLGKLVVVSRSARWGRNPATGEKIKIKAKKALKFRIAKAAKDAAL